MSITRGIGIDCSGRMVRTVTVGLRVCSRMGKEKVVFAPYSRDQIIDIVKDRLRGVPETVFEDRAIQLAARKIASVSGDVRRALAVLRHAAELWEAAPAESRPAAVNASLVSAAQKEMFSAAHMRVRPRGSRRQCLAGVFCGWSALNQL